MEAAASPTIENGDNSKKLNLPCDNEYVVHIHNKMLEYEKEINRLKLENKELKVIIETFSIILYKEG